MTTVQCALTSETRRCLKCGSLNSSLLEGNCPTCLLRLTAGALLGDAALPEPCNPTVHRWLGEYELLEEIARGGMGVVYRARQASLNREVAVKVLLGGQFADPTFIKRFQQEAEAAASLNHPNIVAIHEVGEHQGQPYFSMELIKGHSLAELIQDKPMPARQAAETIRAVAEAVDFAHGCGVLHRDLKPSNVLLDELGVPHITDFGLAKRAEGDANLTLTGQILGSPNYMAPEQADTRLGPATAASDVYSLGAMLYHLLTGRPPFLAATVAQTLRLVVESDPVPPSLLFSAVPHDLETICLKCLEKDPLLRYLTAQELAEELRRFLLDEPIHARPVGPMARLARWCRRKPALAGALAGLTALLLVITIGSPIALVRIQGERQLSEAARKQEAIFRRRAVAGEHQARQQLYTALVGQANGFLHSGEIGQRMRALETIRSAAAISNSVDLRHEAVLALALPDLKFERGLSLDPGITLEVLSPSFESVALCQSAGPVEIRALSNWQVIATLPASTNLPAYVASWSADGKYLAVKRDINVLGDYADVEVWDVPEQRRVTVFHDATGHAFSFNPQKPGIIIVGFSRGIITWDLRSDREISHWSSISAPSFLEVAPDGETFAALTESPDTDTVSIHRLDDGIQVACHNFSDSLLDLAWHPRGSCLAIAEHSGAVYLMDSQTGETRTLGTHHAQAATVAFSPQGDYLLSGGWEGELICWDLCTCERVLTIGRKGFAAQFRSNGDKCALLTQARIELYDLVRPNPRGFTEDLGPRLRHAAISHDGRWLAASADRWLGVWDLRTRGPAALTKVADELRPVFTESGQDLFALSGPGEYSRWQVSGGTSPDVAPILQRVQQGAPQGIISLSGAGNLLAVTGPNGSGIIEVGKTQNLEPNWHPTIEGINGISSDGRWLGIYRPFTPWLSVYRLPGMEPCCNLTCLANVGAFEFSPGSSEVAISSRAGVEFWSTNSWTRSRVLTNFTAILFSPEASTWWLTTDFRTAGLYRAATLEPLLPLPAGMLPLAASSDGRYLAVSVDGRHLKIWDLAGLRHQLRELGLDWKTDSSPSAASTGW